MKKWNFCGFLHKVQYYIVLNSLCPVNKEIIFYSNVNEEIL